MRVRRRPRRVVSEDDRRPPRGIPAQVKRLNARVDDVETSVKGAIAAAEDHDDRLDDHAARIEKLEDAETELRRRLLWVEGRVERRGRPKKN